MKSLFFCGKDNNYYLVCGKDDLIIKCDNCKNVIEKDNIIHIHNSYSKKTFLKEFLCPSCIGKYKKSIYNEFIIAEVTDFIPDNSKLIIDFPPLLTNTKNIDVWDAANPDFDKKIKSDTSNYDIEDKTNYSFREVTQKTINKLTSPIIDRIRELEKPFKKEKEGLDYLDNIKISTSEQEIKQIENKKKE